jgi:ribonuclease HI
MKILYVDSSFNWQQIRQPSNVVTGRISIVDSDGFKIIENVAVGRVEGLKQYNNILELTAIARAVELACAMTPKPDSLKIMTDSKVAMYWASNMVIKPKVATEAHKSAIEYLRTVRVLFGGLITFNHINREQNLAGHLFEKV